MKTTAYKGSKEEARALNAYVKLMRAADSVSSRIHDYLPGVGLSVSQFGVIEALHHLGPLSQAELAKKILKSTGNITMVIDNLEKRELVRRERSAADRRYYAIHLTAEGKKMIARLFPDHAGKIVTAMNVLTDKEQETLGKLCRKLGLAEHSGALKQARR